jgi:hypothetical protein
MFFQGNFAMNVLPLSGPDSTISMAPWQSNTLTIVSHSPAPVLHRARKEKESWEAEERGALLQSEIGPRAAEVEAEITETTGTPDAEAQCSSGSAW